MLELVYYFDMQDLLTPPIEAIYYEDEKVYVCLASFPITKGHSIVVWKDRKEDIQMLERQDYERLMEVVELTRKALRQFYDLEKVYLLYLDEIKHVHWHLVPRYNEEGFNVLKHKPKEINDFSDAEKLRDLINIENF
jgi:diadenosine tetraphosphate (Ap4A) HIT family hydrolase